MSNKGQGHTSIKMLVSSFSVLLLRYISNISINKDVVLSRSEDNPSFYNKVINNYSKDQAKYNNMTLKFNAIYEL